MVPFVNQQNAPRAIGFHHGLTIKDQDIYQLVKTSHSLVSPSPESLEGGSAPDPGVELACIPVDRGNRGLRDAGSFVQWAAAFADWFPAEEDMDDAITQKKPRTSPITNVTDMDSRELNLWKHGALFGSGV